MSGQETLQPTYHGIVNETLDALFLFEACLNGDLAHVSRRPHDRERPELIRSGNIFIYEEQSSGIKRWTDGISWSPSRILGNFLVYRELDQAFTPGEKKRALKKPVSKRSSVSGGIAKPSQSATTPPSTARLSVSSMGDMGPLTPMGSHFDPQRTPGGGMGEPKDPIRDLVGSLTESYDFKEEGLVKKTISIKYQGINHHLVSYYTIKDAMSGRLRPPSRDPLISKVQVREDLLFNQTFRSAVSECEYRSADGRTYITGGYVAIPQNFEHGVPPPHMGPSGGPLSGFSPPPFETFHSAPAPMPAPFSMPMSHHPAVTAAAYEPVSAFEQHHASLSYAPQPSHHHAQQQQQQQQQQQHRYQPHHHHAASYGSQESLGGSAGFDGSQHADYIYQGRVDPDYTPQAPPTPASIPFHRPSVSGFSENALDGLDYTTQTQPHQTIPAPDFSWN